MPRRARLDALGTLHHVIVRGILDQMMKGALPLPEGLITRQKKQESMWAEFFERCDVLLAPVSPTVAFQLDRREPLAIRGLMVNGQSKSYWNNMTWTVMAIVSGLPATIAPVGLSESGLPVGVQIIGAKLEDLTTIAFARGLSDLVGGFVAPPGYED